MNEQYSQRLHDFWNRNRYENAFLNFWVKLICRFEPGATYTNKSTLENICCKIWKTFKSKSAFLRNWPAQQKPVPFSIAFNFLQSIQQKFKNATFSTYIQNLLKRCDCAPRRGLQSNGDLSRKSPFKVITLGKRGDLASNLKVDNTNGFMTLGHSNWTICSLLSWFCPNKFQTFYHSYCKVQFLLP